MDDITPGLRDRLDDSSFAGAASPTPDKQSKAHKVAKVVSTDFIMPALAMLPWSYFTPAAAALGGAKIAGKPTKEQITSIIRAASLHHSTVVRGLGPSFLYGVGPVAAAREVQNATADALPKDSPAKLFLPALLAGTTEAAIGNFPDFATTKFYLASVVQQQAFNNNPGLLQKFSIAELQSLMAQDYKAATARGLSGPALYRDLIATSQKQGFANISFSTANIAAIQKATGIGLARSSAFGAIASMFLPAAARNSMLYFAVDELDKQSAGKHQGFLKFFGDLTLLSALSLPANMITYGAAEQYVLNPDKGVLAATKAASKAAMESLKTEPRKTLALLTLRVCANMISAFILSKDSKAATVGLVDKMFHESAEELTGEKISPKQVAELDDVLASKTELHEEHETVATKQEAISAEAVASTTTPAKSVKKPEEAAKLQQEEQKVAARKSGNKR
jgi:hypothetical protein